MAQHKKETIKPKTSSPEKSHSPYILLVEDEPTHVAIMRHTIQSANPNAMVKVAGSLQEYRSAISKSLPEIALIDMYLPDGKALEVLTSPLEAGSFPIVVMTSSGDEKIAVKAMKAGALDYVVKSPDAFKEIHRTLERTLREWKLIHERKRAEELLQETEKKYKTIIEGAAEGILIADLETRKFKYANPVICSMLGYSADELLGLSVNDIHPPEHLPEVITVFESQARGEIMLSPPIQCLRKDGSVFFVEINTANVIIDGKPCNVGFFTDITERKRAEQQIADALYYIETVFEASPVGIITYKESGEVISANRAAAIIVGTTIEQLHKQNFKELKSWERSGLREAANAALASSDERRIEVHDVSTFGKEAVFAARFVPFMHQGRKELLALFSDITERKRAEEALWESENRFRLITEQSLMAVGIIQDGVYKYFNKAYEEISGYSADEIKKWKPFEFTKTVHPDDLNFVTDEIKKKQIGHPDVVPCYSFRGIHKSGDIRWIDLYSKTVIYENRSADLVTFTDITERKRAEEVLESQHALLTAMINSASDIFIFSLDKNYSYTTFNEKHRKEMKRVWNADIKIGMNLLDCMQMPELRELVKQSIDRALKGEAFSEIQHQPNLNIYYEFSWNPIHQKEEIVGVTVFIRDITERKLAEEVIKQTEENFRRSLEDSPLGVRIVTAQGDTVYANRAILDIYGYDNLEELKRTPVKDRYTPESYAEFEIREEKRKQGEFGPSEYEISIVRKNGEVRYVQVFRKEVFWNGAKQFQVIYQDITERKRVEEALSQSLERYRLLHDYAPVGILLVNRSGQILETNPAALQILGSPSAEATKGINLLTFPRLIEAGISTAFQHCIETGRTVFGEYPYTTNWGKSIRIRLQFVPIFDDHGQVVLVHNIFEDITERKILEEQLRQMQKLEGLGTLAGGIAHDFNNILGIILAYNSSVERSKGDAKKLGLATETITKAVQRGKTLVQQILTFARKTDTAFGPVNVNDVIMEIMSMIYETFPKTLTCSQNFDKSIPYISADRSQLNQMLLNLCMNARDAMPSGGVLTISTHIVSVANLRNQHPDAAASSYVCIEVSDTGEGMTEEIRKRIFEPFFTTKGIGKGTGLGLSVVFGVVQTHRGFIDVESELGEGTTFRIYLPISEVTKPIIEKAEETWEEIAGGTETLLVVEDEEMLMMSLQMVLVDKGYKVLSTQDGFKALVIYQERKKDIALVLTDLGLPTMTGLEVCQHIKAINPNERVILATGFLDPDMKSEFLKAGIQHFLYKPYDLRNVLKVVREVLDEK